MQELSLNILDIAQNSVRAAATLIAIEVDENAGNGLLQIAVTDNGCGMAPDELEKAADPFYTTRAARRVGLGLALLKMTCELTGGDFSIESVSGRGTCVRAGLGLWHIDRPPVGDMAATLASLAACNPERDFFYTHRTKNGAFSADTRLLFALPEAPPRFSPQAAAYIRSFIGRGLEKIEGGRI